MKKATGYLIRDHRASPGIPEPLARQLGLDPKLVGEGKVMEADTLRCAHCPVIYIKNPLRERERAICPKCHAYICDNCKALNICRPFAQVVDELLDGKTPVPLLARDIKRIQS